MIWVVPLLFYHKSSRFTYFTTFDGFLLFVRFLLVLTVLTVLNKFNGAPTLHLPLVVLKLAIIVLAVTNYSKNLKIKGIDTENGKEKMNSKE